MNKSTFTKQMAWGLKPARMGTALNGRTSLPRESSYRQAIWSRKMPLVVEWWGRARRPIFRAWQRGSLAVAMLACLAPSSPAEARDRPGAPINMLVLVDCYGDNGGFIPNELHKGPPAICVEALNTAKENVRFIVRVIANGVEQNEAWLHAHVVGYYADNQGRNRYDVAITYMSGRPSFSKSYHMKEQFALYKLDFDTTYCVSLRTQYDDGVVSAGWTSPPCVRTRKTL